MPWLLKVDAITSPRSPSCALQRPVSEMQVGAEVHTIAEPGKVLHIRNLPPDATEHDVVALFAPFGGVQRVLLLHAKRQALVQCASLEAAARAVSLM